MNAGKNTQWFDQEGKTNGHWQIYSVFFTWSAKGGHVTIVPILDTAFVKAMNFYG